MRLAEEAQLRVEERLFSVEEAHAAAEAFLTSATMLVMPIVAIDGEAGRRRQARAARKRRLRALYLDMATAVLGPPDGSGTSRSPAAVEPAMPLSGRPRERIGGHHGVSTEAGSARSRVFLVGRIREQPRMAQTPMQSQPQGPEHAGANSNTPYRTRSSRGSGDSTGFHRDSQRQARAERRRYQAARRTAVGRVITPAGPECRRHAGHPTQRDAREREAERRSRNSRAVGRAADAGQTDLIAPPSTRMAEPVT